MRIAILGFSPHVKDAPFGDPSWTFWGMNGLHRVFPPGVSEDRFALWFELHTLEFLELYGQRAGIGTQQQEWLARKHPFPILMQEKFPQFPSSAPFPLENLVKRFGRDYFTSSVAYEFVYAMAQEGVEEIGLWGIDLVHGTEWGDQRPCVEYWIGRAENMGIKVTVPTTSALLTQRYRYGFDNPAPLLVDLRRGIARQMEASAAAREQARKVIDEAAAKMQTEDGAIQMCRHLNERLDMWERGGEL